MGLAMVDDGLCLDRPDTPQPLQRGGVGDIDVQRRRVGRFGRGNRAGLASTRLGTEQGQQRHYPDESHRGTSLFRCLIRGA